MEHQASKPNGAIRPIHLIAIAVLAVVVIGAVYAVMGRGSVAKGSPIVSSVPNVSSNTTQLAEAGDMVSLFYTGTLSNGTVFDSDVGGAPLNFTLNTGQVIAGFNNAVLGMSINQSKTFTIPANEAYGPVNQSLIFSVPRSDFANQTVTIGMGVSSSRGGTGRVVALNATNVTLDFNNPLAGQALTFAIKVVGIRK